MIKTHDPKDPSGRLIVLMKHYSGPMVQAIMTEKLKPIERMALIKMISLQLDATASLMSEKVTDPKDRSLVNIILGV